MPKAFSENEREYIKTAMLDAGGILIRKKGLRQVTIEDITNAVNIAKGSFYSFYKSREELFWDVIKHEEQQLIKQIKLVAIEDIDFKSKAKKILKDLFLAEDCIVNHLPEKDVTFIVRKLPTELVQADLNNGQEIIKMLLAMCDMDANSENVEILMTMIHTLQYVCTCELLQTKKSRKIMLDILVDSFADYLGGNNI